MKKISIYFLTLIFIFTFGNIFVNAAVGDIDQSGELNSIDYALLKRHILGVKLLSGNELADADVNFDNAVDSSDYAMIKRHLLGIINLNGASPKPSTSTSTSTPTSTPIPIMTPTLKPVPTSQVFAKIEDSLMTYSGLTVVSYGGYLNGESFQQDAIISYKGYQYTAFWNTKRSVVFARRSLPNGEWKKFEFTDYTNTANDAHNTISLGICPNDGTIHLAFDHHGNDLHYRRSIVGFANEPDKYPWDASSFGKVTSNLGNTKVTLVTYPKFVVTPQGNLLLEYRYGTSGSGDQYLWEYSGNSQTWTSIGKYIDGIGDSINAYPHGLSYGKNGTRLHMTWCWRETPDATTNHDLLYIYSDDNGRTWKNNSGVQVGKTGSSFVTKNSPGIKVWTINQNRGLINQEHHIVDSQGRVHVLLSHMPDSKGDDSNFTNARTKSEFFHYWRNTDGTWKRNSIGVGVVANFRGKLAVSSKDNLYAILPDLRIAYASANSGWSDWKVIDSKEQGRFFSDPLIDTSRLLFEDKLSIFYPAKSSPNIYVLTYSID